MDEDKQSTQAARFPRGTEVFLAATLRTRRHWHFQTPHEVQDDYDVAFEHYMGSKKEVAATRMALLKEKRIAELEENPRSPGGASFVESVEEARSEKPSLAEALRAAPLPPRGATSHDGRAQRNGQAPHDP